VLKVSPEPNENDGDLVRAYVINLARSPERRGHMVAELDKCGLDYEVVNGIDWRDMSDETLRDPKIVHPFVHHKNWFRPGVAGCALSHVEVYRRILADGLDTALVLEDDVALPKDLGGLVDDVSEHMVGAEVTLLSYDSDSICKLSREGAIQLSSSRTLVLPIDVGKVASAAAFVITREACKRMNDSLLPVRAKADDWGFFFREGVLDRVRCVFPIAVEKSPAFASTIDYNPPGSLKARLLATAIRHDVPFLNKAISYRRQRIWSRTTGAALVEEAFIEKPSRLSL
jgi:glycosyl transferase family 25